MSTAIPSEYEPLTLANALMWIESAARKVRNTTLVDREMSMIRGALSVPAQPVASTHTFNLRAGKENEHDGEWCREVLLYSPNNPGDIPKSRVKLYIQPPPPEVVRLTREEIQKLLPDAIRLPPGWEQFSNNLQNAIHAKSALLG